jgi:hypothetical protein
MRNALRFSKALPLIAIFGAGCSMDSTSPAAPVMRIPNSPSFVVGDCTGYLTSGILDPVNADGSSVFQISRTIPLKIRITGCASPYAAFDGATPLVSLTAVGDDGSTPVNEVVSSSAADDGNTMRLAGDGQYIFNLSTKRSQFNNGLDLTPGRYQLTISGSGFADISVGFSLRK